MMIKSKAPTFWLRQPAERLARRISSKKKAGDVTALASVTGHTTVTVRGGQVSTRCRDVSVCWGGADPFMKPMGESRRPGPCPACLGPRPPAPGPRPQTHPAPAAAAKRYGHGKPAAPPRPAPPGPGEDRADAGAQAGRRRSRRPGRAGHAGWSRRPGRFCAHYSLPASARASAARQRKGPVRSAQRGKIRVAVPPCSGPGCRLRPGARRGDSRAWP